MPTLPCGGTHRNARSTRMQPIVPIAPLPIIRANRMPCGRALVNRARASAAPRLGTNGMLHAALRTLHAVFIPASATPMDCASRGRRKEQLAREAYSTYYMRSAGGRRAAACLRQSRGRCEEHWHIRALQRLPPALLPSVFARAELAAVARGIGLPVRRRRRRHDRSIAQRPNHALSAAVFGRAPEGEPRLAGVPAREGIRPAPGPHGRGSSRSARASERSRARPFDEVGGELRGPKNCHAACSVGSVGSAGCLGRCTLRSGRGGRSQRLAVLEVKTPSANRTRHAGTILVEERACHSLEPVLLYRVGEILPPSAGRVRILQRAGAQRWDSMHARRGYPWTALSQRSSAKVQRDIRDPDASAARLLCGSTSGRRAHASVP